MNRFDNWVSDHITIVTLILVVFILSIIGGSTYFIGNSPTSRFKQQCYTSCNQQKKMSSVFNNECYCASRGEFQYKMEK